MPGTRQPRRGHQHIQVRFSYSLAIPEVKVNAGRQTTHLGPLRRRIGRLVGAGLDLLIPPQCNFCHAKLSDSTNKLLLCRECQRRLLRSMGSHCPRCGAPAVKDLPLTTDCPRCRGRRFYFDSVFPLGVYKDELRQAVVRMKQQNEEPLSAAMGRLVGPLAESRPQRVACVPMRWSRRLMRSTNSPEILVLPLARRLVVPASGRLLRCRRNSKRQNTLSTTRRFRNVRDVFAVSGGYNINGARILLVDDILTTGTTASGAARVLRTARAKRVTVVVIAWAGGPEGPA